MTGGSPSFSIVVPTYQRRAVVCDMLRTVAALEYRGAFELIVVVDGSTDGTVEALRALRFPFPYQVIEQDNAGAAAARNRGAAAATGDILLFLDDDMMCEPDLLAQHARSYAGGADAVIGDYVLEEGSAAGFLADGLAEWTASMRAACSERGEVGACDLFSGQFSVKRQVFADLGGFDETLTRGEIFAGEDTDFGVRLLREHKLVHQPAARTRQRYLVKPSEIMKRTFRAGRGAAVCITRYPLLTGEFFDSCEAYKPVTQLVYRPLARARLLVRLLAAIWGFTGDLILRSRWRSNRLFAQSFNAVRSIVFWSALQGSVDATFRRSVLVLCYHAIADHADDPLLSRYSVPPDRFRAQIDWLARHGHHFVTPGEFLDFLDGKTIPPPKSVLLTFDDCYLDLADAVRDVLAPRRIPALAFCVAGIASRSNEWDQARGASRQALLSPTELAALRPLGLETGSHSLTHRQLPSLARPEQIHELRESATVLENDGLPRPRFFAYPHGESDAVTRRETGRAGFAAAFGVTWGRADRFCDRFDIPRVSISANDSGLRLRLKTKVPSFYYWLAERTASLRDRVP